MGVGERTVRYQPERSVDPSRMREVELELEELRRILRDRTIEIEFADEIKRERTQRRRELRIETDD